MSTMAQLADLSSTIPAELVSHVHLTSTFRYPAVARLEVNEVVKWLLAAPLVARDKAPFFWRYIDKPPDGTIYLTWQPLQRLGTNFATDGFVWAPPEQIYKHDLGNGIIMEIYSLKTGYIPGEQLAGHSRRRFRLVPAPNQPGPPIDPNLFIVHYGPSDPNDRMPIAAIPYDERVAHIMQQRSALLSRGIIRRKEFMLGDRNSWPSLPELAQAQFAQPNPRGIPQQMAYPPGPPAKRARQQPPALVHPLDDAEDVSRGDMFDHATPRDLAVDRYKNNHEWMEEILSSAYRIGQIIPSDLGLGLKGELASLTEGIFAAHGGNANEIVPKQTYVGKLNPGQADEFRKRVNEYITTTQAEISKMKHDHEQDIQKIKQDSAARKERELSYADKSVEDILKLEASLGRKIEPKPSLVRVEPGGYQNPTSRQPSIMDMDMGNTASGLLDQMHTGLSAASTPAKNTDDDWVVVPKDGTNNDAKSATPPPPPPPAAAAMDNVNSLGDMPDVPFTPDLDGPMTTGLSDGLDLNMDMDDSAFGEAFHVND